MHRLILTFIFPSIVLAAQQGSYELSTGTSQAIATVQLTGRTIINLDIAQLDYEATDAGIQLSLPETFGQARGAYLGPESAVLPTITRLIAIPFDSDPTFRIINSEYSVLYNITLAPANAEDLEGLTSSSGRGASVGQPELVRGEVAGVMRDLRLYALTISPVQYDPQNHQLRVCRRLEIEIDHSGSQLTQNGDQISEAFLPIYHSILDNPLVFDPIRVTRGAYWIIYPDTFRSNIQAIADWKKAKGFDVVTISKTQLGTNNYLAIRDSILSRYNRSEIKPDYIAIIGDVVMPSGNGIATREYDSPLSYGNIESDNFYTFLFGDDYFPDILIGRISIDYAADLTAYTNKLFQYERTPYMTNTDWYLKATVVAGSDGYSFLSPRLTKLWCREMMFEHGYTRVDTFFASYSGGVTPAQINASINNGVSYVNYRGYGTPDGWTPPNYTSGNIMQLTTTQMFPIMTSVVCATGDFNDAIDVCFGETWIRAAGKGGAGFVGNSNHYAHTRWTNAIDVGIYWGLFMDRVATLAQAELMGKMTLYNAFPEDRDPEGEVELYFNSYNILGDPEINCWTAVPKAMTVTCPDSLPLGQNRFDVLVQDELGAPLAGAVVCLWKQNEVFATGFTGADGSYQFPISSYSSGQMRFTATCRGYIPVEDSIVCYETPLTVGYLSYIISDDSLGESRGDNDGTLNPSERIEVGITLQNYGLTDTAYGVVARLTTNLPGITILRDSALYTAIAPGASASPGLPFTFDIGPNIPNGTSIPLLYQIADSSGHHWQGILRLPVLAAQVVFDTVAVVFEDDNGRIDPGEAFGFIARARNIGSKPLLSPQAILRCGDSHIQLFDSVVTFGNILPGDTASNWTHPFLASIDNSVYIGHLLNFNVTFTGLGPQIVSAPFSKTVGLIAARDPIGPDSYGYYCFDNTDSIYAYHPTYNWIDISTSWTYVTLDDDDVATIALPFPVRYYGQAFENLTICDNGYVAMGRTWFANFYNGPIPGPQNAEAMIAPFWDDFTQIPLRVYYHYDDVNGYFIIGWKNALDGDANNNRNQTFEIIFLDENVWPTLTDDNEIIFQYYLAQLPYTMSAGICSPDRRDGIGYSFNGIYAPGAAEIISGRAIKFTTGSLYVTAADEPAKPGEFSISQNYPNPFNAATIINFNLPEADHVTLDIFNIMGQKIETLANADFSSGPHSLVWNAANSASGIYFYRLSIGEKVFSRRMTLLK